MPWAAAFAAPWVSSDRWTEASNPVIVYWVRMKPNGMITNQNAIVLVDPSDHPDPLNLSVKTWDTLRCWSGTKSRTPIRNVAPTTCHHTEMLLNSARRWLEKMLITVMSARIATKIRKTRLREKVSYQPHSRKVSSKNVAQP